MTREEEIRQASIEYTCKNNPMCIGGSAFSEIIDEMNRNYSFEEGAKWADNNPKFNWINVEDDLLCNHEELMKTPYIYKPETVEVVVKDRFSFSIDYMIFDNDKWKWGRNCGITHWFPIPALPKGVIEQSIQREKLANNIKSYSK